MSIRRGVELEDAFETKLENKKFELDPLPAAH